ncbi:hypothetical protein GCM10023091_06450 [Ravibacter arvi]|uniref:histidine kinase n=1 Tax=Ravibacter arvi TaxID=2051041 RepID=A0ABP8LQ50_9BACT
MSSKEQTQLLDAVACGVMRFRKEGATGDFICNYANEEAEKVLGDATGKSWTALSGAYSLPIRFGNETLNFPNGKIYQVVKQQIDEKEFLFTLLDISSENRVSREIEDFLFIASHDLQEPLRKIISFGERIERNKASLGEENSLYLTRMLGATGRMQNMLGGLLSFSRIGQGGEVWAECDLSEIVQEAFLEASQGYQTVPAKFSVGRLPTIEGHKNHLLQLFKELFLNALKFQHREIVPEITVTSEVDLLDKTVVLRITDNGIGFGSEHAERIFLLFHRLNGRTEFDGTGIGLAVCKKIVEKHSGEIKAYSAVGKGSTFLVTLPLTQSKSSL